MASGHQEGSLGGEGQGQDQETIVTKARGCTVKELSHFVNDTASVLKNLTEISWLPGFECCRTGACWVDVGPTANY